MTRSLSDDSLRKIMGRLEQSNARLARLYPGESGRRQPIHTVYGGAHLFKAELSRKLGAIALRTLDTYAPDPAMFGQAFGLSSRLAENIRQRVRDKLEREPVEDFRIDFEDGYGNRPDAEEDGHAMAAAEQMAAGMDAGKLPPFCGIRIKPLSEDLRQRSIRTLDLFISTLLRETSGRLPPNFVVTLPKVVAPEQMSALVDVLELLEGALGLPADTLKVEFMVEVPQTVLNERGESNLLPVVSAARGRCIAAHFGTYDYTASCGITAAHQQMLHPACDFAKNMMQVALAGTGIWLSDGATNVMPVPVHAAASGGPPLSAEQKQENRRAVHRAWALQATHIRHSLTSGYYQGWDLHPAQLPARYAAVYTFFLKNLDASSQRLRNFVNKSAQATRVGEIFDDAATGQGLLNYFLRAINCGAITEAEALPLTGLTPEELRMASFVRIMQGRTLTAGKP